MRIIRIVIASKRKFLPNKQPHPITKVIKRLLVDNTTSPNPKQVEIRRR